MGKGEPFIISDAAAPDTSRSTSSAQAKANVDWQPQGPTVLTPEALKESLGPRRLVAPQCTLVNGTSFSNYKGDSPERRGESFISSTCEVAWEHVVDGILLERPLPVAAKCLEGRGSEGQGFGELDEGFEDTFNILNIQLNGTKHWTVFPDEAKKHIQDLMSPKSDARQRRGPLDLQEPLRSKLKARSCLLRPFEVLYIPGGFWHDVYSLTPSISLSVRLAQMFERILQQQRALGQR
uniref:JmjC domain-containing protein n=1 Tax=Alexandrium catenella TaxID=2925 RepID=A0A7S1SCW2_ALECA